MIIVFYEKGSSLVKVKAFLKEISFLLYVNDLTNVKGVVLVRYEDGKEKILTKYIYLKMKNSGRNIELIKEAPTVEELVK